MRTNRRLAPNTLRRQHPLSQGVRRKRCRSGSIHRHAAWAPSLQRADIPGYEDRRALVHRRSSCVGLTRQVDRPPSTTRACSARMLVLNPSFAWSRVLRTRPPPAQADMSQLSADESCGAERRNSRVDDRSRRRGITWGAQLLRAGRSSGRLRHFRYCSRPGSAAGSVGDGAGCGQRWGHVGLCRLRPGVIRPLEGLTSQTRHASPPP